MNYLPEDLMTACTPQKQLEKSLNAAQNLIAASQNYGAALSAYANDFLIPFLLSTIYFNNAEQKKFFTASPMESFQSYLDLLKFNLDIFSRNFSGGLKALGAYNQLEMSDAVAAVINTLFCKSGQDIAAFIQRQADIVDRVVNQYPKAIAAIEPEYGFHFERGINPKIGETARFNLYQIMPTRENVTVNTSAKPMIILPPYVLGSNILGFLPGQERSYAHAFANKGIPTYLRVMKNIHENEAVQIMAAEDDTKDTRLFCEMLRKRHGKPVTLNGYCQGGFSALCNLLSGELDDLVDAMITCVSPMDGTRSKGLSGFLQNLPGRFNDLLYGTKKLPSGNQVADGLLMGWVYKLKSIEAEGPISALYRDLLMFDIQSRKQTQISKSAAAINYWLTHERTDLPLSITAMSFASYNTPITADGTLPVQLFGRKLNFERLKAKKIKWQICYGEKDDLVEKEAALAPLDYFDAEIMGFPKGHVAIATSWSSPSSEYALHKRFSDNRRGPVRFQLDLDEALSAKPITR